MNLRAWAAIWNIPQAAITDLQRLMMMEHPAVGPLAAIAGEGAVQNIVRLEAARKGVLLWRNNNGALEDKEGRWVRFGLANDSKAVNERIKSADLVGIKTVTITAAMVGHTVGQFVSREIKAPGWKYAGTAREEAQKRWAELILAAGGDAGFATGEGSL